MNNNNINITFKLKDTLQQRGAVDPLPPKDAPNNLLVATEPVATWEERHSEYGHDNVAVYPAFVAGQRAWLVKYIWCAAHGYCASGGEEEIIDFEEGVKLLLEHGAYQHL